MRGLSAAIGFVDDGQHWGVAPAAVAADARAEAALALALVAIALVATASLLMRARRRARRIAAIHARIDEELAERARSPSGEG